MKRIIPIVLILALATISAPSEAAAPAWFQTMWAMFFTGDDGTPRAVTPSDPMPVTGTFTASLGGGVTIATWTAGALTLQTATGTTVPTTLPGCTSFSQVSRTAGSAAASWTTSATCEAVTLFSAASTTIWFSLDGAGATVSVSIPLTGTGTAQAQQSFSCGPNKVVYYVASVTSPFLSLESGR